jgi:hypothetical protein
VQRRDWKRNPQTGEVPSEPPTKPSPTEPLVFRFAVQPHVAHAFLQRHPRWWAVLALDESLRVGSPLLFDVATPPGWSGVAPMHGRVHEIVAPGFRTTMSGVDVGGAEFENWYKIVWGLVDRK